MRSIVKEIASVWILYLDGNLGEDIVALCGFFLSVYAIYSHVTADLSLLYCLIVEEIATVWICIWMGTSEKTSWPYQ